HAECFRTPAIVRALSGSPFVYSMRAAAHPSHHVQRPAHGGEERPGLCGGGLLRHCLLQLVPRRRQPRGRAEEAGERDAAGSRLRVLPHLPPEELLLAGALLDRADEGGEEGRGAGAAQASGQRGGGQIRGDPGRVGIERPQVLLPRRLVPAELLERLAVQLVILPQGPALWAPGVASL